MPRKRLSARLPQLIRAHLSLHRISTSDAPCVWTVSANSETRTRATLKRNKPVPKIGYRYGNQDRMIKKFLENREFLLKLLREVKVNDE